MRLRTVRQARSEARRHEAAGFSHFLERTVRRVRVMRRLVDELVAGIGLPVPTEPDALFDALIRLVSAKTGRELIVLRKEFPHRTASGLWLDLPDRDIIVIDERATPLHQIGRAHV